MADISTCMPLTAESVAKAHSRIRPHIHRTPVLTNKTLDRLVSSPRQEGGAAPKVRLFFKCENMQKIGAFKARGAFHAVLHLIDELGLDEVKRRGVITHSSGNHAQALALAAATAAADAIPAYIIMPTISTPSKIEGTKAYTNHVIFSGSTSEERESKVDEVMKETGSILVPPYDHPDIMLGQGTSALELYEQHQELRSIEATDGADDSSNALKVVIAPLGGGGLLSGTCIFFSDKPETYVFGAEPSYEGGDDGKRGLESTPPSRITSVKTLTIADGLRTPLGENPWSIFTSGSSRKPKYLQGVRSVSEEQIKDAMRRLLERMKVFVEPSACVGLAALLYDEEFRQWIQQEQKGEIWDIGVILSGGNTTLEAITAIFGEAKSPQAQREEGKLGLDGSRVAENVAG